MNATALKGQLEEKRKVVEFLIDRSMVLVVVDATIADVRVPLQHQHDQQLRLNFSRGFAKPDFQTTEFGFSQTLSFKGQDFNVYIPWTALRMAASHQTREYFSWEDDIASELGSIERIAQALPKHRKARHLRVVK